MLEIGLADEAGATMRAAPVVTRWKAVDPQNAEPAPRQLVEGRAAHAADSQHDHVEVEVLLMPSHCEHPCYLAGQ